MPVPRHARPVDAEAGGHERVERLAFADRAAVPLLDVQTAHAAQRQRRLDDGLQRADGAGYIHRLPAGQCRERAALPFDEQHGTAVAHDQPRRRDASGGGALAVATREREHATPEIGGIRDRDEHVRFRAPRGCLEIA